MIRPASTLLMLRSAASGLEVLMARRTGRSSFAGGVWVFPGGVVDEIDNTPLAHSLLAGHDGGEARWVAAAFREAAEEINAYVTTAEVPDDVRADLDDLEGLDLYRRLDEAGLEFDAGSLAYLSNWLTPRSQPTRFDTRFFVVEVPADIAAREDGAEITEIAWVDPQDVLGRGPTEWPMIFPTVRTVRHLATFASPAEVVAAARSSTPEQIEPRPVLRDDGKVKFLIPGDPGFEEAAPDD